MKKPTAKSIISRQLDRRGREMGNKKIKILCYCDTPTAITGFATVSKNILKQLYNTEKYEIVVWGINYYGLPYDHNEFPYEIYPASYADHNDLYGRNAFVNFMSQIDFDILWTLNDPSVVDTFLPEAVVELRRQAPNKIFQWIFYFPIDSEFIRRSWFTPIMTADFPVCYNQWTYDQLTAAAPELKRDLRVIPHGIDANDFFPISNEEKLAFRKDYWKGMINDDTFLVINVNRNQQRKDFYRTLKAFKLFKDKYPNSHLYIHCKVDDVGGNLMEIAAQVGLIPKQDFSYPHPDKFHPATGMLIDVLNKIYNVADIVMSTTLGEGCGLSSHEAFATKTPIVMPNHTALIETLKDGRGFAVKAGGDNNLWEVMPMDNSIIRPLTDVDDMAKKLGEAYNNRRELKAMGERGYNWVMNRTWSKVCREWNDLFEQAAEKTLLLRQGKIMNFGGAVGKDVGAVRQ